MSLKAYDGMMTRNGLKYIQDGFKNHLDELREISLNKLGKSYADIIMDYVDNGDDMYTNLIYEAHGEIDIIDKLKQIKLDDVTLISLLHQSSKILSTACYVNKFTVHLNVTLEALDDKILVYPNIIVHEHRDVLLKFLDDWYCQDQCDEDETVPTDEWEQRKKDWYDFDETRGMTFKIHLFEPHHHWNSLNKHFRGDELFEYVLKNIPTDDERIRKLAYNKVFESKVKQYPDNEHGYSLFYDIRVELKQDGNTEIDDYIKNNDIELIKVDKDFLTSKYFKKNR